MCCRSKFKWIIIATALDCEKMKFDLHDLEVILATKKKVSEDRISFLSQFIEISFFGKWANMCENKLNHCNYHVPRGFFQLLIFLRPRVKFYEREQKYLRLTLITCGVLSKWTVFTSLSDLIWNAILMMRKVMNFENIIYLHSHEKKNSHFS